MMPALTLPFPPQSPPGPRYTPPRGGWSLTKSDRNAIRNANRRPQ